MRPLFRILVIFAIFSSLTGCDLVSEESGLYQLRGNTMGTSYTIKALPGTQSIDEEALYNDIKATLDSANDDLSNWIEGSAISNFNESHSTEWMPISEHFLEVLQSADVIHTESGGRFDITVSPLIDMWGFGPADNESEPSEEEIRSALGDVGQSELLEVKDNPPMIRKKKGTVSITLGAIAKGYSADLIGRTLEKHGIFNYLVEIGGDLMTHGVNESGVPWRIGIEKPDEAGRSVQLVVSASDMGVATSGDYRNFYFDKDGRRMSHIIDPVTGRPVTHNLASVTVIEPNGKLADGWATALLVLGEEDGRALADKLGIAAYFIRREKEGFVSSSSKAFAEMMKKQAESKEN